MKTNAIESAASKLRDNSLTRRDLLEQHALGGRYVLLVGSPTQVADELLAWIDETGLDGFNLTRIVTPESYADFIDLVVPELQARGAYKTAYAEGTLRHKVFGAGDQLPADHRGARVGANSFANRPEGAIPDSQGKAAPSIANEFAPTT